MDDTLPHPNRITPFNELIATQARGTLMGNRGILHDGQGRIIKPFAHRNWPRRLPGSRPY